MKFLTNKIFKGTEFFILCLFIPGFIVLNELSHWMFFFLWAATAYCMLIDRFTIFDGWKSLWRWGAVNIGNLKPLLTRFILACIGLILFTWWYDPQRLFFLPQNNPDIIWRLALFYPLLSALPQEYIFCRFFFNRYEGFFGKNWLMIIMSAAIFALAHVLFINPIAPTFGFAAGIIFAHTYWKTKSLALVTIEHALYGLAIFIIGLGWYFYTGSIG